MSDLDWVYWKYLYMVVGKLFSFYKGGDPFPCLLF